MKNICKNRICFKISFGDDWLFKEKYKHILPFTTEIRVAYEKKEHILQNNKWKSDVLRTLYVKWCNINLQWNVIV